MASLGYKKGHQIAFMRTLVCIVPDLITFGQTVHRSEAIKKKGKRQTDRLKTHNQLYKQIDGLTQI